jgi:cytochrome c oxidase subunit 4
MMTDTPEEHLHTHPSDLQYVKIAALLAVITAAEVTTYFWKDIFGHALHVPALVAILFPMMIAKFAIVVGYFLHLRYDNPLFRKVFIGGLVLAVVVYCIALSAFSFWTPQYLHFLRKG